MQVGVSQLILPGLSTQDFIREAAGAAYEVAELTMKTEGDLTPDSSDDALAAIVETAAESKIELVSMVHGHCGQGNLLADGEVQRHGIDLTIKGLTAAQKLGLKCTLHTLGRLSPELYYDDAYRNAQAALREIGEAAADLGVALAVEFVWNGFLFSPLEMRRFLDEIANPYIGFYFDPGNMAVFQQPHHWVRIVGPHIKMVHLKDWTGGPLNGSWPALLEGDVDYVTMNRELRAIGYDGPMISEVPPSDASLADTAAAIRKIIAM